MLHPQTGDTSDDDLLHLVEVITVTVEAEQVVENGTTTLAPEDVRPLLLLAEATDLHHPDEVALLLLAMLHPYRLPTKMTEMLAQTEDTGMKLVRTPTVEDVMTDRPAQETNCIKHQHPARSWSFSPLQSAEQ